MSAPAGWHPTNDGRERYWDGNQWTEHYRPVQGLPPGPPPAPPRKSHTLRNVLLVLLALGVLFVGGCFALVGLTANEIDRAVSEEQENDRPFTVEEGAAFEHDGYSVEGGWSVQPEEFGGATIEKLRATLDDDQDIGGRTAQFTFRLYQGSEVVGEVECSSNEMQEGETSRMDCYSLDSEELGEFDEIRVADMF